MKKTNLFLALAAVVIMVTSCSKSSGGGDYVNVIPADASAVVSLNLNSIGEKAGLNDQENRALMDKFVEAMSSGLKPTSADHVQRILNEPGESGISVKDPLYVVVLPGSDSPFMVAKVSDEKKLRATLDVIVAEQIANSVAEKDGYNIMLNDGIFFAYNKSSVIMGKSSNFPEAKLASLFGNSAGQSINENSNFQKMVKKSGDILYYASLGQFAKEMSRSMNTNLPDNMLPGDFVIIGDVSFEKGKIVSHAEFASANDQVKAMIESNSKWMGKVKGNFLDKFPVNPLMFVAVNVNGEQLFKSLLESEEINKAIDEDMRPMIMDFMKAFKGDVSFGLLDMAMMGMPGMVLYADTDKEDVLDVFYQNKSMFRMNSRDDIIELAPHQYQYKSMKINFYFGVKDGTAYFTTDQSIANGTKVMSQTLKDARYAASLKGKHQYMVIDIQAIIALPVVQMMSSFGGAEYKTALDIASRFSHIEISSNDPKIGEFVLYMTDKDTNVLKQFVNMGKQFSGMN